MTELLFRGLVGTGNATFDGGISDLMVLESAGGPVLVSVSANAGGLVSYGLSAGVLPAALTWRGTVADMVTPSGPSLFTADGALHVVGLDMGGISGVDVSASGVLSWPDEISAGSRAWSAAAALGDGVIALAEGEGNGLSLYQQTSSGGLRFLQTRSDTGSTYAQNVIAMDAATVGTRNFIIVASSSEQGVSVLQWQNDTLYNRGRIGPPDGLGIMTPSALEVVESGAQTYVIVASAPSNGGASGALSVMQLDVAGQLRPTDHVLDTLTSRFGQVQDIATTTHNGVPLIAVGGGDDGVTLLAMTPDGQLVHLASFADTNETGLTGVTALEMVMIGSELRIFAASGADNGLTVLTADLSNLGQTLSTGDGSAALTGTSGDDILVDGAGTDTLSGGAGSDIFVLTTDGQTDRIMDFDPSEDRLDLSGWPLLYDVSTVTITVTSTGALVSARGEQVLLISPDRRPLDPEEVRAAIDLTLDRSFLPPEVIETGTGAADFLEGSWGMDELSGAGGNDTLCGGQGDDTLIGGAGTDRAEFGIDSDTISRVTHSGDSVTIVSAEGQDVITGVEYFEFTDRTLSLSQLAAMETPDTIQGGNGDDLLTVTSGTAHLIGAQGDDTLVAAGGNDTLWGGADHDDLSGGAGNDSLTGGSGNDTLRGGDGTDWALFDVSASDMVVLGMSGDRATLQSADGIDVIDGIEFLRLGGSVLAFDALEDLLAPVTVTGSNGNDSLTETSHDAVINGLGGADTLTSGSGADTLSGDGGNDVLNAGSGQDSLDGGSGNDLLQGGVGNDTLRGGTGNDTLRGGDGTDRAVINGSSTGAVTIDMDGDRATIESADGTDVIEAVEFVQFSNTVLTFADLADLVAPTLTTLTGDNGSNTLSHTSGAAVIRGYGGGDRLEGGDWDDLLDGGSGHDTLSAGRGNDTLVAGTGNDSLMGLGGNDTLLGGAGDDTLKGGRENDSILGDAGDDSIVGQRNLDTIGGGDGDDTLKGGGGADHIYGEGGRDFIKGGTYADFLKGGQGNDTLIGNRHDDTLIGGWGSDELNGGGDNDSLDGGGGNDTLKGGAGEDVFVFNTGHDRDVIEDFNRSDDTLEITSAHAAGQSASQIVAGATITSEGVLIDFGGGDTILLQGLGTLTGLTAAIDIV